MFRVMCMHACVVCVSHLFTDTSLIQAVHGLIVI